MLSSAPNPASNPWNLWMVVAHYSSSGQYLALQHFFLQSILVIIYTMCESLCANSSFKKQVRFCGILFIICYLTNSFSLLATTYAFSGCFFSRSKVLMSAIMQLMLFSTPNPASNPWNIWTVVAHDSSSGQYLALQHFFLQSILVIIMGMYWFQLILERWVILICSIIWVVCVVTYSRIISVSWFSIPKLQPRKVNNNSFR